MKALSDEEIQQLLEKELSGAAHSAVEDKDFVSYQLLFKALKAEPEVNIPHRFSHHIVVAIDRRRVRKGDARLYSLITVLSVIGLCLAFVSLQMIDQKLAAGFFEVVTTYKWIGIFVLITTLTVQLLDRKISIVKMG